jgi:RNA polymerase sigma factor (sigma-70 family)
MQTGDLELLRRWSCERDAEAFHEIVNRYAGLVYAACLRVSGSPQDAEDTSQDCFLTLAKSPPAVRASLGAWLHRLATHRSLDRIRGAKRRESREEAYARLHENAAEPVWDDIKVYVDEAIDALPDKNRSVVVRHFLQGQTYDAIAKADGAPVSTIATRAQRGVDMIREHLDKRGVTIAGAVLATLLAERTAAAVPATLLSSLGKITLASNSATAAGTVAATSAVPIAKWAAAGVLIVVAGASSWWYFKPEPPRQIEVAQAPSPTVIEPTETAASNPAAPPEPRIESVAADSINTTQSVSGRVFDARSAAGLSGVQVFARQDAERRAAMTDDEGRYTFEELPEGAWRVTREHVNGYQNANGLDNDSVLVFVENDTITGINFPMDTGKHITGVVVDSDGQPIDRARVYCHQGGEDFDVTYTGETGAFVLSVGLSPIVAGLPRDYYIVASKDGFGAAKVSAGPIEQIDPRGYRLVMEPEAVIEGTIVDLFGKPIPDLRFNWNHNGEFLGKLQGPSSASGQFRVAGLPAGTVQLRVYPPGMSKRHIGRPVFQDFELTAGQTLRGARVIVDRSKVFKASSMGMMSGNSASRTIAGVVRDAESGAPVTEFLVQTFLSDYQYSQRDLTGSRSYYDVSHHVRIPQRVYAANGAFEFIEARAWTRPMKVRVMAEGYAPATAELPASTKHRQAEPLMFELHPAIALAGTVVDTNGDPVHGAEIYHGTNHPSTVSARSSSDGAFALRNLAPGSTTASVEHPDYFPAEFEFDVSAESNEPLRWEIEKGGIVTGLIRLDGEPAVFPDVEQIIVFYAKDDGSEGVVDGQSDENGRYTVRRVPAGVARVDCIVRAGRIRNNKLTRFKTVKVNPGQNVTVDFDIQSGGALVSGTVYQSQGVPATGSAWLHIQGAGGEQRAMAGLDDDGRFSFGSLIGGLAKLDINGNGRSTPPIRFELAPNEVLHQEIYLFGGMSIEATVQNLPMIWYPTTIQVLPGKIEIENPDDQTLKLIAAEQSIANAQVDDAHQSRIAGLGPGTYTVICLPGITHELPPNHPLRKAHLPYTVIELSQEHPTAQVVFEFSPAWFEDLPPGTI